MTTSRSSPAASRRVAIAKSAGLGEEHGPAPLHELAAGGVADETGALSSRELVDLVLGQRLWLVVVPRTLELLPRAEPLADVDLAAVVAGREPHGWRRCGGPGPGRGDELGRSACAVRGHAAFHDGLRQHALRLVKRIVRLGTSRRRRDRRSSSPHRPQRPRAWLRAAAYRVRPSPRSLRRNELSQVGERALQRARPGVGAVRDAVLLGPASPPARPRAGAPGELREEVDARSGDRGRRRARRARTEPKSFVASTCRAYHAPRLLRLVALGVGRGLLTDVAAEDRGSRVDVAWSPRASCREDLPRTDRRGAE